MQESKIRYFFCVCCVPFLVLYGYMLAPSKMDFFPQSDIHTHPDRSRKIWTRPSLTTPGGYTHTPWSFQGDIYTHTTPLIVPGRYTHAPPSSFQGDIQKPPSSSLPSDIYTRNGSRAIFSVDVVSGPQNSSFLRQ